MLSSVLSASSISVSSSSVSLSSSVVSSSVVTSSTTGSSSCVITGSRCRLASESFRALGKTKLKMPYFSAVFALRVITDP